MPSVLSRYLAREVFTTWVAVTVVLLVVMLSNRFVLFLRDAVGGQIASSKVASLLGYTLVVEMGVLLPASFFLATVLAFGRLYRDNEMVAMVACGIGPSRWYRGLLWLTVPLTLVVAVLAFSVGPWAARERASVMADAQEGVEIDALRPGRFVTSGRAKGTVYVERMDNGQMHEVFLETVVDGAAVIVTARRAAMVLDESTGQRFLTLYDGFRYEGVPGELAWRWTAFERHRIRFGDAPEVVANLKRRALPTSALLASGRYYDHAELAWRASLPFMVLVLTLLVVPVSRTKPREGRYGRLLIAVVVYAVYANAVTLTVDAAGDGDIPVWSLVVAHGVFLAAGWIWLHLGYGGKQRPRRVAA